MKPLAPLPLLCLSAVSVLAQGTVNFVNVSSRVNAPVFYLDGVTKVAGPNFLAQLYAGPTPNSLAPVGDPTPFFSGGAAGYFNGGTRSIPGVPGGTIAYVNVVVWDSTLGGTTTGATDTQAFAYMQTGHANVWGASAQSQCSGLNPLPVLTANPGASPPEPPTPLLGLQSFALGWGNPCGWFGGFLTQPQDRAVLVGAPVTFSVQAECSPPPSLYLWFFSGNLISEGTANAFSISNAQPSNAGWYQVAVYHPSWGTHYTDPAQLTVLPASLLPQITRQPQPCTAEVGTRASFSVEFTSTNPASCQWFFNQTQPVPGGTNSQLWLSDLTPTQAGTYAVTLSNILGSVTSTPAALSVVSYVPRRPVPALEVTGQPGIVVNLELASSLVPPANWQPFATLTLSNASQFYCDPAFGPEPRFYRAWQTGSPADPPGLHPRLAPAIALSGRVGQTLWLEGINIVGPTDAWFPLATIVLTNTSELYPDVSSIGQPPRLWRIVAGP